MHPALVWMHAPANCVATDTAVARSRTSRRTAHTLLPPVSPGDDVTSRPGRPIDEPTATPAADPNEGRNNASGSIGWIPTGWGSARLAPDTSKLELFTMLTGSWNETTATRLRRVVYDPDSSEPLNESATEWSSTEKGATGL